MNRKLDEERSGAALTAQSGFLATRVADAIVEMIAGGRLAPGQRLVEPVLARTLGVGTVPVREALRVLAGDGVVELVPNRGARLREMTAKQVADTLKAVTGLLLAALEDLPPPSAASVRRLEAIAGRIDACHRQADGPGVLAATDEYQRELVTQSGNEYILTLMNRVHFSYYIGQLLRYVDPIGIAELPARYQAITAALKQADMDRAKALFLDNRSAVLTGLASAK